MIIPTLAEVPRRCCKPDERNFTTTVSSLVFIELIVATGIVVAGYLNAAGRWPLGSLGISANTLHIATLVAGADILVYALVKNFGRCCPTDNQNPRIRRNLEE